MKNLPKAFLLILWGSFLLGMISCKKTDRLAFRSIKSHIQAPLADQPQRSSLVQISIPDYIQNTDDRAYYYLENYWNSFSLKDSTLSPSEIELLEKKVSDYFSILFSLSPSNKNHLLLLKPLQEARGENLRYLFSYYSKFLNQKGSKFYSPRRFNRILEWGVHSPLFHWKEQEVMKDSLKKTSYFSSDLLFITRDTNIYRSDSLRLSFL